MNPSDELIIVQRLAHIGSWYWDIKTGEKLVSEELCRIFGREVIPPFAEQCETMYASETWKQLNAAVREAVQTGVGYELELPAVREDGTAIWINARSEPVRNANGEVVGLRGTVQDTTERRQAEETLRRQVQIIDQVHDAIITTDLEGVITGWNAGAEWMFGYAAAEALGQPVSFVYPEDQRAFLAEGIVAPLRQKGWHQTEARVRRKSGSEFPIHLSLALLKDTKGVVVGMVGSSIDITEFKRAEQALREKEQLLSESQRMAHIGGWSWDLTGPIRWTDETYRIYGVSPDTFIPTVESLVNLVHPEDRPEMQRWLEACAAGEKPGELEFRAIAPNGSVRLLSGRGELMYDAENKPALMTGTVQDISERRQVEQERERLMRQLESLSERLATGYEQERRKIAYELHEELGQELATLKFYLKIMGLGSGGMQSKASQEEALALVVRATERVRNLVLDIEPLELADFGLDSAVRTHSQRQAVAGGWTLHVDAPKPDVRVPQPLERACFRVLQEGLSNVLHHAKATEVWVRLHQGVNQMELDIRDNGIGFDSNAFHEEKPREGASLGLFGIQIRAKQVGGTLQIKSALGNGTELQAIFPFPVASVEPV